MKRTLYVTLLTAATLTLGSCNEDEFTPLQMGAINIVNAVSGGTTVKMGTALRDSATVNTYRRWSFISGNTEFKVFPTNNPSTAYFSQTAQTQEGDWYSLFLTGTAASPEGILLKENFPTFSEAQCAIRVVNLSPNGTGLNVILSSTPTVNEFSNLAYKQVTEFKTYVIPFSATYTDFTFQLMDETGVTVLATLPVYDTNGLRYDSASLVIYGQLGGTGTDALGMMYVPHY